MIGVASIGFALPAQALPRRGALTAFDAADGSKTWSVSAPRSGGGFTLVAATRSAVFGVSNRCYWDDTGSYAAGDSNLVAWAAKDGHELWRVPDVGTGVSLTEPPGGTVITDAGVEYRDAIPVYSSSVGLLRGLSTKNGKELWRIQTGDERVVEADGTQLALTRAQFASAAADPQSPAEVSLLDGRSGVRQWSFTLDPRTLVTGAALMPSGVALLLITTPETFTAPTIRLAVYDRATGALRWDRAIDSYGLPDAGLSNRYARITHTRDVLLLTRASTSIRVDPESGAELWRLAPTLQLTGSTTSVKPVLFARPVATNGQPTDPEVAIDAASGKIVWKAPMRMRVLTVGDGGVAEMPDDLDHQQAKGFVVDPATGAVRWSTTLGDDDSLLAGSGAFYRGTGCPVTLRD